MIENVDTVRSLMVKEIVWYRKLIVEIDAELASLHKRRYPIVEEHDALVLNLRKFDAAALDVAVMGPTDD